MFNKIRLKEILAEYKKVFVQQQWPNEKYKWEAVQCFQENCLKIEFLIEMENVTGIHYNQSIDISAENNLWLRLIICLGLQITFQKE
mgnify:CR=1 FL=1